MNNEGMYSDYDILVDAVNTLGDLKVTVNQMNDIGIPVARVVGNLRALMEAIERNRQQQAQAEAEPAAIHEVTEEQEDEPYEIQEIGNMK